MALKKDTNKTKTSARGPVTKAFKKSTKETSERAPAKTSIEKSKVSRTGSTLDFTKRGGDVVRAKQHAEYSAKQMPKLAKAVADQKKSTVSKKQFNSPQEHAEYSANRYADFKKAVKEEKARKAVLKKPTRQSGVKGYTK